MVGAVLEGSVLLGANAKRLNRDGPSGHRIEIALRESGRVGWSSGLRPIGIEAVGAGERPVFVVEGAVLVEDHENVFDLLTQCLDVFL
jgi:hypothetical protein